MGPLMPIESLLSPEDDRTPALLWVQETLLQRVSCTQRDKGTPFKYRGVFYSYKGAPSTYGRTPVPTEWPLVAAKEGLNYQERVLLHIERLPLLTVGLLFPQRGPLINTEGLFLPAEVLLCPQRAHYACRGPPLSAQGLL